MLRLNTPFNFSISLLDLHLFRSFYCLTLLGTEVLRYEYYMRSMTNFIYFHPIPLFEFFKITRFSPEVFSILFVGLCFSLLLSSLGILTRSSLVTSLILFFLVHGQLLSLTRNPTTPYAFHSKNICFFILLFLAFDSQTSNNSFITNIFKKSRELLSTQISGHSFFLVLITLAAVYFGSSYLRLVNTGLGWMDGETLQAILFDAYFSEGSIIAFKLAHHKSLCQILSIAVMAFELSFIFLVLFARRYLNLYLFFAGLTLHLSIHYIMNINFLRYHGYTYLIFLFLPPLFLATRWDRFIRRITGRTDETL